MPHEDDIPEEGGADAQGRTFQPEHRGSGPFMDIDYNPDIYSQAGGGDDDVSDSSNIVFSEQLPEYIKFKADIQGSNIVFEPKINPRVELTIKGETETIRDQCRNPQTTKGGEGTWELVVEGPVLYGDELLDLKTVAATSTILDVQSQLHNSNMKSKQVTITQEETPNTIKLPENENEHIAFTYSLKLTDV